MKGGLSESCIDKLHSFSLLKYIFLHACLYICMLKCIPIEEAHEVICDCNFEHPFAMSVADAE